MARRANRVLRGVLTLSDTVQQTLESMDRVESFSESGVQSCGSSTTRRWRTLPGSAPNTTTESSYPGLAVMTHRSLQPMPGRVRSASATGPMKCTCARYTGWKRPRNSRSLIPPHSSHPLNIPGANTGWRQSPVLLDIATAECNSYKRD